METIDPNNEQEASFSNIENEMEVSHKRILEKIKSEIQRQVPGLDTEILDIFLLNLPEKGQKGAVEAISELISPKLNASLKEAFELNPINELLSELEPHQNKDVLMAIKEELEKASLKLQPENIQLFLSVLASEGLDNAFKKIGEEIAPKTLGSLQKICESSPIKELIVQLPSSSKSSGPQAIVQIIKKELTNKEEYADRVSLVDEYVECLLKNGVEGFLSLDTTVNFLFKLELAFIFFSNEEITNMLENSDESAQKRIQHLGEIEAILRSYAQDVEETELIPILQSFKEDLDCQVFLEKVSMELAPKKFNVIKEKIEKDKRVAAIIEELKSSSNSSNQHSGRFTQAKLLGLKLKIGKQFIKHCGDHLEFKEAEDITKKLIEYLDLDGAITEVQENVRPKDFPAIERKIKTDKEIQNTINELKKMKEQPSSPQGEVDETQIMLNKMKGDIWDRFNKHLSTLDQEMLVIVKEKVLEEFDLQSLLTYLQNNLAPNKFAPLNTALNDTEIENLMKDAKDLKENAATIIKRKKLEGNMISLLNKHKPELNGDESEWGKVQENLKNSLSLEDSISFIEEFIAPNKCKKLVKDVTEDTELIQVIQDLKEFQSPRRELSRRFISLLELLISDNILLNQAAVALEKSLDIKEALNVIEENMAPKDFKALNIQSIVEEDKILAGILKTENENNKEPSNDKILDIITNFIIDQIISINNKISSEKIKSIRRKISESVATHDSIRSILDDIIIFISESKLGLPSDKLELIKQEALSSPSIADLSYYFTIKETINSLFKNCQICDNQLLLAVSSQFYETKKLEESLALVKEKYPESYGVLLNLAYYNEELERIVFERLEKDPNSFLSKSYIKNVRSRIKIIAKQRVKFTLMVDLLEHIHENGLHNSFNLNNYQEDDKLTLEHILDLINKDSLRTEIDEIKAREELQKDIKEVIDLKPELLNHIIDEIMKKGLMNALLAEADNNLNTKIVNECLNKIVPFLQDKEVYKSIKLSEKDLATWSDKTYSLFAELMSKTKNKEDLETLTEIKTYLKNGSLEADDIQEINWVLTKIGMENKYLKIREFVRQIFERDYATLVTFKELESKSYGEERNVENLTKYQLKFTFQFKDLESYMNKVIIKNFEMGEELYNNQLTKYQDKNILLTKPELLNYKEYIQKDKQILPILIELEVAKESYKKTQDQKILDDVNKRIIPKLFSINKDLYEMWNLRNKPEDFPVKDYEVTSSEYALYPVEACNKAKKIASYVKFSNIHLNNFNVVTFRSSQEDQDLMIKNWIENIEKPESFENLLPIYFNLLKRGEDWKTFVEKVSYYILDKKLSGKLGFFQRKFLFYLLLVSANKELKARLLQLYGSYNPIPLRYPKWPIDPEKGNVIIEAQTETLEYEFNELIYYTIQPSLGILSLGLGNKASLPIGKSRILNKVFKKNFSTAESSPFHVNTIDIDFDSSFRPYRQFCIADAHGNFPLKELAYFLTLFKVIILHVHADDLKLNKTGEDLRFFCDTILSRKHNNHLVLFIRDDDLDEVYYEEDREILRKRFPQLETVIKLPEKSVSIASLRSMIDLNPNEESVMNQKLQTTILGAVQLYKDERTVNKETFINNLLKNLKNEQQEIPNVDKTLKAFLAEIKKYINNFFDEKAFPCRSYLSELRKVQKVLRTAKTDDELNKAQITRKKLEEKLKGVKSTTLLKLFAEILRKENSYLVVMELSREIKDIILLNSKELMAERDTLLKEIKPKASNKDDPSNTDEAQRLKLIENQNEIKKINEEIDKRSLSIEVIWRELMTLYTYNKNEVLEVLNLDPVEKIKEFLDKGEPFELIDGDNLQFNENTLKELFATLKGKMCTICVLGPQSSGKSTLLNYLFGCQFVSSVGRCTRGIYLSIQKIHNNPNYEYLMILDTEGLQSVEKNDDEFDRKITLFCLAVSQIVLVNVKGDIHLPMKSLMEICTLSLHGLNMARIDQPDVYFVFNQNPPTKDKTPFMNQISKMMNEIIEANPEAKDVAKILCPNEDSLHSLGFAFQTSKEERNVNKNIWQDWPYIQPQSSFANECATLSQIIYKTMNDRFLKASQTQNIFTDFKEWSSMANEIWKTIDMFPNLLEFGAIRHMKQDRELRIHGTKLLEAREDRLNGEKVIAEKINSLLSNNKNSIILLKQSQYSNNSESLGIISNHYETIKKEVSEELMGIRERENYDYDLTKRHEKHILDRVGSYEQEAILLIKRDTLKTMLEIGKVQGLQGITDKIGDYLLDAQISGSKEAAEKKFEELWSNNIEQGLNTFLNLENHDETLWTAIFGVYTKEAFLPDLGTSVIRELHSIINKDPKKKLNEEQELSPLIAWMIETFKKDVRFKNDDNDIFRKDISIRYKQPTQYFSLAKMLQPMAVIHYFYIEKFTGSIFWYKWKEDINSLLNEKIYSKESYFKKIESLLNAFVQIGYFPRETVVEVIHNKIRHPPRIIGTSQSEIKSLLNYYTEYNILSKERLFEEKKILAFEKKENIPNSKYWRIDVQSKEIALKNLEESVTVISEFEKKNPQYCVIKNCTIEFRPKGLPYYMGLKYCIDPFDYGVSVATALGEIKQMILNGTDWSKLLKDIYENIMKELNVKAESISKEPSLSRQNSNAEDEESYYRDISSFCVDLVKNVVKKVDQKLEEYHKEILRCAHKLDMGGTGKIHFFSLLIVWKTLCFASRKRLMEPVDKIMKEKEKWKNYFVSSVNNNSYEKSASFAERVLIEYLAKLKNKIINNYIKPNSLKEFDAKKDEFNTSVIQKKLDDLYLSSKNSEDVLNYVMNQVKYYEDHFDLLWLSYYDPLLEEQKKNYRTGITNELGLILQSVTMLKDFFKNYHKKEVGPLEIFEIRDARGSILTFNQNVEIEELNRDKTKEELLKICSRAQFTLFNDFFSSQLDENWKYQEGQYTLTIKGLNGSFKAKLQVKFAEEANLNKKENEISYLTVFLNSFESILNQDIKKILNEELNWGYPDVGLDKLYQAYKNSSVGCTDSCPTCGKKCDRSGSNHTHGCDSGHQIRGMFGIIRGKHLSSRTCDEIKPDAEIMIDKVSRMKWGDFVRQRFPTWDFTQVDQVKTQETILKYRKCWENHGDAFAKYFADLYGQEILVGFSQESESYHIILTLDGSGSMAGNPWENAKKGASSFLSKLKQFEDSVSEVAISIIVFTQEVKTTVAYQDLNINLDQILHFPGGGTAFGPPLKEALNLISNENGKNFQKHFILFYTDGGANYPQTEMNMITNFAEKSRISLYALSDEANPTVLKTIANEFNRFSNGEVKSSVSPDMLVKELPEVLNSIFHKVD